MIEIDADLAVVGSGFGGSLTALLARRVGLRVALVERGSHPRFSLGESSTPMADLILAELARRYNCPRLLPLTRYGAWRACYPGVMRGLKRGFSYFHHGSGVAFVPRADHANELLVAANPDASRGDTHWLRADVDAFLVGEAVSAGAALVDRTTIETSEVGKRWTLRGRREGEAVRVSADFLVDATGDGGFVGRRLSIPPDPVDLRTRSYCLYSHFRGVRPWRDELTERGGRIDDHPFPCDEAALHHVFEGGWMYVLRFDDGMVSAGLCLDPSRFPPADDDPADAWVTLLRRFPSIAEQFRGAEPVRPIRRTTLLQRLHTCAAGPNWAMLPTAAGFVDALHSTGNAHTLTGIQRLIAILAETEAGGARNERLRNYSDAVRAEVQLIDALVDGCYRSFNCFEAMVAFAMFYFAAATYSEQQAREETRRGGFLLSHDPAFVERLNWAHGRIRDSGRGPGWSVERVQAFQAEVAMVIRPYNVVGLCDPTRRNMYPYPGGWHALAQA